VTTTAIAASFEAPPCRDPESDPCRDPYPQASLLLSLQIGGTRRHQVAKLLVTATRSLPVGRLAMTYTIFEGTSEIQRLVIARSISGVHIP
jgi:hypothetical protein